MIQQTNRNMSQCVALETARYLTDPVLLAQYIELQEESLRERSLLEQLWRIPKFRLFMLRLTRLALFLIFMATAIFTIAQDGRWVDFFFWVLRQY